MKAVLIPLTVLLLAGCASKRAPSFAVRPRAVSGTTLPSEGIESVRYAENIKAYPLPATSILTTAASCTRRIPSAA
jgi:hypothetical protein